VLFVYCLCGRLSPGLLVCSTSSMTVLSCLHKMYLHKLTFTVLCHRLSFKIIIGNTLYVLETFNSYTYLPGTRSRFTKSERGCPSLHCFYIEGHLVCEVRPPGWGVGGFD
jgi:hypothetical protein